MDAQNPVGRVAAPPEKPLLIFDGDCAFCRRWIERCKQTTGERVDYAPLQNEDLRARFPELPPAQLETAVHLVEPDGRVTRGAEAVFRSLAPARRWPLWLYENFPALARSSEWAYILVARHRSLFSRLTQWLWGPHVEPPSYFLVRWLFVRLVGVVYLIAFLSLDTQLPGLVGSHGIVPAHDVMQAIRGATEGMGIERFHLAPTLCWWSATDGFLRGLGLAGVALSALVILGLAPGPCLFLLWLDYLSLSEVSTVFLGYQWDSLLLETGFLAIFLASARPWPNLAREAPPSRVVLWLLRWLLFRLMFSSGAVKLVSGDLTWRNLTALSLHFETQPLPTPLAWYAHNLPASIQRAACAGMFFVELVLPLFIFLPRRPRFAAFWGFVLFMAGIALTGNYTFFNLLTCVLCLTLLDDFALARLVPRSWRNRLSPAPRPASARPASRVLRGLRAGTLAALAGVILAVTSVEMLRFAGVGWAARHPLVWLYHWVAPFRSVNGYGLFAVMTTTRPEIIVEGSRDRQTWEPYEFRYKAGDLRRRPPFVAPHQPRLDWQMWFAALEDLRANPWFASFCLRLLQGQPEVLALLERNPFPERPPEFLRASLYEYHFTTPAERAKTGDWWRREYKAEYCPAISLRSFSSRDRPSLDARRPVRKPLPTVTVSRAGPG